MLRTGKRCPNAAVPPTRYCALPAHSRLAGLETSLARPLTAEEIEQASTDKGFEQLSELAPAAVAASGDAPDEEAAG